MSVRRSIFAGLFIVLLPLGILAVRTQSQPEGEWRYYGGDKGYTRYSPLDQINKQNVGKLQIVWRRPAIDAQFSEGFPDLSPSPGLQGNADHGRRRVVRAERRRPD